MIKKIALGLITTVYFVTCVLPQAHINAVTTNIINNPSFETANASGTTPTGWKQGKWGTNTTTFSYAATGHTGTRSASIATSKYTSGDAKWYFTHTAVKPNQKYDYTEYYKSNVSTEVDIEYADTAGKLSYVVLASPVASAANWAQVSTTFTTPATVKTMTIFHVLNKVGTLQTDDYSISEAGVVVVPPAVTAPTVTFSTPTANATVAGTQAISANASDSVAVVGIQFKIDNAPIGAEDTVAPYTVNLDTKTLTNSVHALSATARNSGGLTTTVNQPITVLNPTAPTVSIISPVANVILSGTTQQITASASDTIGIANVQFKLDGANLGDVDTTAPYAVTWDTTTTTNGPHSLTAIATNTSNLSATSTSIAITVQNIVSPPIVPPASTNLIKNPSFEVANAVVPQDWISGNWGTNTATFSYLATGHTGGHSAKAEITAYTNGAANWYYTDIAVTPGKSYKYENWYQSNVDTEVDAEVTMTDGTIQYFYLGNATTSATWAKISASFTAPTGAKAVAIYQILGKKGYLITDDYSLTEYTPAQFTRALVSLTFDDGWRSIYTNGLPLLTKYGLTSTQYLNSQPTLDGYTDYMTAQHIKDFYNSGHELAWHTRTHADITKLAASVLTTELNIPTTFLQGIGQPATTFKNFATPFGAYNSASLTEVKKLYRSHRSTDVGYNTKDSFDIYNIRVQNITSTTTPADIQAWVSKAIAEKTWLVIVYHEVDTAAADTTYSVTPANLDAELNIIKQSGVTVKTVNQSLDEITPQL